MTHTHSQDLEAHFNTLQSGLLETQKEKKIPKNDMDECDKGEEMNPME